MLFTLLPSFTLSLLSLVYCMHERQVVLTHIIDSDIQKMLVCLYIKIFVATYLSLCNVPSHFTFDNPTAASIFLICLLDTTFTIVIIFVDYSYPSVYESNINQGNVLPGVN